MSASIRHHERVRLLAMHDKRTIPVWLFAHGDGCVAVEFGETGAGQFTMQLRSRGARELAVLLASFADIADGLADPAAPLEQVDPMVHRDALRSPFVDEFAVENDSRARDAAASAYRRWREENR